MQADKCSGNGTWLMRHWWLDDWWRGGRGAGRGGRERWRKRAYKREALQRAHHQRRQQQHRHRQHHARDGHLISQSGRQSMQEERIGAQLMTFDSQTNWMRLKTNLLQSQLSSALGGAAIVAFNILDFQSWTDSMIKCKTFVQVRPKWIIENTPSSQTQSPKKNRQNVLNLNSDALFGLVLAHQQHIERTSRRHGDKRDELGDDRARWTLDLKFKLNTPVRNGEYECMRIRSKTWFFEVNHLCHPSTKSVLFVPTVPDPQPDRTTLPPRHRTQWEFAALTSRSRRFWASSTKKNSVKNKQAKIQCTVFNQTCLHGWRPRWQIGWPWRQFKRFVLNRQWNAFLHWNIESVHLFGQGKTILQPYCKTESGHERYGRRTKNSPLPEDGVANGWSRVQHAGNDGHIHGCEGRHAARPGNLVAGVWVDDRVTNQLGAPQLNKRGAENKGIICKRNEIWSDLLLKYEHMRARTS